MWKGELALRWATRGRMMTSASVVAGRTSVMVERRKAAQVSRPGGLRFPSLPDQRAHLSRTEARRRTRARRRPDTTAGSPRTTAITFSAPRARAALTGADSQ